ncbi:MAG TPA: PDZ domain-containing protein, partial [Bacillota bacterium]|nr:PDZ domain-containing protein [Bacillota bacterium]
AAESQGIGFSIPSNTVRSVANQLIEKGYVSRPGLGIFTIHFVPENVGYLEARLRRDLPVDSGLFIAKVFPGTPAERAGLLPGDIIYQVDGRKIKSGDLVQEAVAKHPIGTQIKLDLYRENKKIRIAVKIGEMRKKEEIQ